MGIQGLVGDMMVRSHRLVVRASALYSVGLSEVETQPTIYTTILAVPRHYIVYGEDSATVN
ncbi:hypothetical protein [Coleofasciculus sp.]|uniref:hypothetical protein n=1 Tax=Coleofasciculus sp. TaxID=3100458 RepID=UPI003A449CD3